ncbi:MULTISPECIES: ATP-dependent zinc metalloprotease FtsH [unclassified Modestobacter]|uniref:ATP-dependent zinc metalloprotease FtsH n=1 Tax=unclassified Modestobacter TaxID=2643866 RepID=UPI0022AB3D35|nr:MULTISPECIES: ATP-dependent zinc metalloprotease FtsH [unclassified Modestobacter]MCZ2803927.1 ATP-dependent zinc metalloprotease FtsH [Modestobacter sp. VKM Ac-2983]MCZ2825348.1 ATP-dependent zinc metalloprotease FtsH [Modestobacter sp. VKM Ac-2981]MCZ2853587.1 ATP-dependent zinc metalloprotease FtsH [Modestobacter sp. VKM Ac-2982]
MERKKIFRSVWFWIAIVVLLAFVGSSFFRSDPEYQEVSTSTALAQFAEGNVDSATINDREQTVDLDLIEPVEGSDQVTAFYPVGAEEDVFDLVSGLGEGEGVDFDTNVSQDNLLVSILVSFLPFVLLLLLLFWLFSSMQGGGRGVMAFGKSKAKIVSKDTPKTTFGDVAGADEAIQELHEIKDFLQNPVKYQAIGAKIPKGVLLFGPPGTGKTLLARAVAGEAGVPFYSISGSDFVEMFVGVGASRVRDLFTQAKENAPAIIFIDEIDAVGRQRGAGMGGGHDEREQTLNQMLVEMDGFDVKGGVIMIAATNRPDVLDPALLRPGRFDRQIPVDRPDLLGRTAVLKVHATGKPLADDVDLETVARRTPGFTGADLANVLNEAALLTARQDETVITDATLEEAIDRVLAGPERKTRAMSEKEKKVTAYHEGGHALVAHALPNTDPVHKVTILPRGRSLGHTLILPTEDRYTQTRSEMIDTLAYALGGRAAEELVFHEPTTGAGNDIEKATSLAKSMVTQYGMSAKLGAVKYGSTDSEPFLGRDMGSRSDYSDAVAADIDGEVRALIEAAHDEAWEILVEYRDVLDRLVLELLERETLSREDMDRICTGVVKRPSMAPYNGFGKRTPSERPPVLTPAEVAAANGGSHASTNGEPKLPVGDVGAPVQGR